MSFTPTCQVCGLRPGTIGMVVTQNGRRAAAAVCEICAQQLAEQADILTQGFV